MCKLLKILVFILGIAILPCNIWCKKQTVQVDAEYFLSTKASRINLRVGPGIGYKVSRVYVQTWIPLKVIEELDNWVHVVDIDNVSGWVHKNMLSHNRYVQVKRTTKMYDKITNKQKVIATIKKYTIAKLMKIKDELCYVEISTNNTVYKGWVRCSDVFGV